MIETLDEFRYLKKSKMGKALESASLLLKVNGDQHRIVAIEFSRINAPTLEILRSPVDQALLKPDDDRLLNPYASPKTLDTGIQPLVKQSKTTTAALRIVVSGIFMIVRGGSAGFTTMILLVHGSGTSVHWHNVIPMLGGLLILLAVIQWIEWHLYQKSETREILLWLSVVAYALGSLVAFLAGLLGYFPTPFR